MQGDEAFFNRLREVFGSKETEPARLLSLLATRSSGGPPMLIPRLVEAAILWEEGRACGQVLHAIPLEHADEACRHALAVLRRLKPGPGRDNVLEALARRWPIKVLKVAPELPTDEEKERVIGLLAIHGTLWASRHRLALELKTPACRGRALRSLLMDAPVKSRSELSRAVVSAARQSGDEAFLEEAWQQVVGPLPEAEVEEGLADLRTWKEPKRRARLGQVLLSQAEPRARGAPARELLEAIRQLAPEERAAAFGGSSRALPDALVAEAMELLREAPGGESWFRAHEGWVPHLTEAQLDRLLREAEGLRARVLLQVCAPELGSVAEALRRDVHEAEPGCLSLMVMLALAARHPGQNRERLIDRALAVAAGQKERSIQAGVLLWLAPLLDVLPAGAERMAIESLEDGAERPRVMGALGRLLSGPVMVSLLETWARSPPRARAAIFEAFARTLSEPRSRELVHQLQSASSTARAWWSAALAPGLAADGDTGWLLPVMQELQRRHEGEEAIELFSFLLRSCPERLVPRLFERALEEKFARTLWFLRLMMEWSDRLPWLIDRAVELAGPSSLLLLQNQSGRQSHEITRRLYDLWRRALEDRLAKEAALAAVRLVLRIGSAVRRGSIDEAVALLEVPELDAELRGRLLLELVPHLPERLVPRAWRMAEALEPTTRLQHEVLVALRSPRSRERPGAVYAPPREYGRPGMEGPLGWRRTPIGAENVDPAPQVTPQEQRALALEVLERLSPPAEPVLLGTSAPAEVSPGDDFTVRFVACVERLERELTEKLAHLGPGTNTAIGFQRCQWQLGSKFRVRVTSPFLHVSTGEQELLWNAEACVLDFGVQVPPRAQGRRTSLQFEVFFEGARVALLRHDLTVVERKRTPGRRRVAVSRAPRTAFASFAADDRNRVLDRVASLRLAAGLDVFMDCLSLKPGEPWKKVLRTEIQRRDVFLLFWSRRARDSQWVEWEWRTALRLKRRGAIQPHPLEPVSVAPPPKELAMLHFGDAYVLVRHEGPPPIQAK